MLYATSQDAIYGILGHLVLYYIRTDYFRPGAGGGGMFLDAFLDEHGLEHVAYNKITKHHIVLVMLCGDLNWVKLR